MKTTSKKTAAATKISDLPPTQIAKVKLAKSAPAKTVVVAPVVALTAGQKAAATRRANAGLSPSAPKVLTAGAIAALKTPGLSAGQKAAITRAAKQGDIHAAAWATRSSMEMDGTK